jgi:5'-nucleotidase (lipoprotein e(P4) family)
MKRIHTCFFILLISIFTMEGLAQSPDATVQQAVEQDSPVFRPAPQLYAVLFQQTAAEYRALCYQAFNVARFELDRILKEQKGKRPQAVVVDIDETMLDNSPYEARCILEDISYPEGWDQWMHEASARAVPGAVDFLDYAQSLGVQIFYISNRREKYMMTTLENMKKLGFPLARPDNLLLRREERSKKARREQVAERADIIMLIGDNLADFSEVFELSNAQGRFDAVDRFQGKFGSRFILLPNAIYGDWLTALLPDDPEASDEEKYEKLKEALIIK